MTWANDKENGHGRPTTGSSSNSAASASSAAQCRRLTSTTSTAVSSSTARSSGLTVCPSTGAKPKKESFKSYARPAIKRRAARTRTVARTTTANSTYSRSRRQKTQTTPSSHRRLLPGAQNPERTSRHQQPPVRRADVASHPTRQRQNEATAARRTIPAATLEQRLGQAQTFAKSLHGRSCSAPHVSLPDRLRLGGL